MGPCLPHEPCYQGLYVEAAISVCSSKVSYLLIEIQKSSAGSMGQDVVLKKSPALSIWVNLHELTLCGWYLKILWNVHHFRLARNDGQIITWLVLCLQTLSIMSKICTNKARYRQVVFMFDRGRNYFFLRLLPIICTSGCSYHVSGCWSANGYSFFQTVFC